MKIKLIYPPSWLRYNTVVPMGITTLAASLRSHHFPVEMVDMELQVFLNNLDNSVKLRMKEIIDNFPRRALSEMEAPGFRGDPDNEALLVSLAELSGESMVGLTVMGLPQLYPAFLLSAQAKKRGSTVVWGGDFASSFAKEILGQLSVVDFVVKSDGTDAIVALAHKLQAGNTDYADVPNLVYRNNSDLFVNPLCHVPIERVPAPDYEGLNLQEYVRRQKAVYFSDKSPFIMQYIALLGCVYDCTYCSRSSQHIFDVKSPAKIVSEIQEMARRYGSNACKIEGNELNPQRKFFEDLVHAFRKTPSDLKWSGYARLTGFDYDLLSAAHDAGLQFVRWGIESGSQGFHTRTRKGYHLPYIERTLRDSSRAGIFNLAIFMVGSPHETDKEIDETVAFIHRNAEWIDAAKVNTFGLLSESELYLCPDQHNIVLDPHRRGAFHEVGGLRWEDKQVRVREHLARVEQALADNGMGMSGTSSDLVFTALLETSSAKKAKEWLRLKHPYMFEPIPHLMVNWLLHHPNEEPHKDHPNHSFWPQAVATMKRLGLGPSLSESPT